MPQLAHLFVEGDELDVASPRGSGGVRYLGDGGGSKGASVTGYRFS